MIIPASDFLQEELPSIISLSPPNSCAGKKKSILLNQTRTKLRTIISGKRQLRIIYTAQPKYISTVFCHLVASAISKRKEKKRDQQELVDIHFSAEMLYTPPVVERGYLLLNPGIHLQTSRESVKQEKTHFLYTRFKDDDNDNNYDNNKISCN